MAVDAGNIVVGAATLSVAGTDIGYTKGGVSIRQEQTFLDVEADQAVGVVRKARTLERLYVKTMMLEVTLSNLRRAFMYPAANLVGSTLTLGYNNACWVDEVALVIVGPSPDCGTRTVTLTRCVKFSTIEYSMKRDEETAIEVEFEALKDASGHFGTMVDT